ncbi:hypothetical protein M1413_00595, partial [Patescibacteria group bacterium]|nr:hypothetical protein [Patescibacteria group bacterium]
MPKGKYLFLILAAVFLLTPAFFALAQFVGPSQTPPSGGGTLQVDTNYNVGLGTSSALITPTGGVSFGRLFTISSSSNPGFSLLTGTNRYAWYADTASGTLSLAGSTNGSGGNRVFQITPGGTVYGYDYHSINNQNYYVDPGMSLMPYSALFAGNVGIGTTAPMGRLDLETPGGTTSTSIIMGANGSPSYGKYSIIRTDNANGTGFATYDDRYAGSNTTWQRGDTGLGTVYLMNLSGSQPNGSVLSLYDGSNNVKVSLNTGGNSYFNGGNVGIGTASPSTLLDVNGLFTSRVASGVGAGDLIMQTGWIGNAGGYIDVYTDNVVRSQIGSYSGTNTYFNAGAGGYVGIGTSTPSTAGLVVTTNVSGVGIDVAGNRIANLGAPVNPNDAATKSYVDSSYVPGGTAGNVGGTGTSGYIPKWTSTSTIANSGIYQSGSNIGIGTTAPGALLDVEGTYKLNGTTGQLFGSSIISVGASGGDYSGGGLVQFASPGGTNLAINYTATGNARYTQTIATNGSMQWTNNAGNTVFYSNSGGNVGIGTTTPTTAGLVVATNVSSIGIDVNNNRIQNVGTPINAADAATKSYVDSAFAMATSTQYWTLSGSNLYPNSTAYNIGIGTTNPSYKLTVSSAATGTSPLVLTRFGSGPGAWFGNNSDNSYSLILQNGSGVTTVGINSAASSYFNGGNVGIGTSSPTTAGLVVATNVSSVGIDVQNNRIQNVGTPINAADAATKSYVDSAITTGVSGGVSGTTGYVAKFTGTNSVGNSAIYQSGSNVGIGTTNPGQVLTVSPNSAMAFTLGGLPTPALGVGAYGANPSNGIGFFVQDTTTGYNGWIGAIRSGNENCVGWGCKTLRFEVPNGSGAVLDAINILGGNGYVGVNTTSPATNLDVNGNINVGSVLYDRANTNYYVNPSGNIMPYAANLNGSVVTNGQFQSNVTNTGGLTVYGGGSLAYSVRTSAGGGWAWRFVSGTALSPSAEYFRVDYSSGNVTSAGVIYPGNSGTEQSTNYIGASGGNFYLMGGNVGIGTASPIGRLNIVGSGGSGQGIEIDNREIKFRGDGIAHYSIFANEIPNYLTFENTSASASTNVTGTVLMAIGSNGHIGIGTTNPTTAGLVVSTNVSSVGIDVNNNRIQNVGTPINAADAATKNYVDSAIVTGVSGGVSGTTGYVAKFTGTNSVGNSAIYQSGSNITIGTTTSMNGGILTVNTGSSNGGIGVESTGGQNIVRWYQTDGPTNQKVLQMGLYNGSAQISGVNDAFSAATYNFLSFNLANGYVGVNTSTPGTNFDVNGNIQSSIYYDRDNTNYYIDAAANVMPYSALFAGSVGIGTTNPATPLEVNGALRLTSAAANADFQLNSATRPSIYETVSNVGLQIRSNGTGVLQLNNDNSSTGDTSINGSDLYVKASTGNVGIGTTNPGYKLSVNGTMSTVGKTNTQTGNGSIDNYFYASSSVWRVILPSETNPEGYGAGPSNFGFYDNTTAKYVAVFQSTGSVGFPSGNVGIGTNSPTTAGLVVASNVSSIGIDVQNNRIQNVGTPINAADAVTKSYVDSAITSGVSGGVSGTTGYVAKFTGTNSVGNSAIYQSGSNVGIGTTGPGAPLEVVGTGSAIYLSYSTSQRAFALNPSSNGAWTMYDHAASGGTVWTGGITQSSGYVGIDITPATTLDVNGNINVGSVLYDRANTNYYLNPSGNIMPYALNTGGGINIGGGGTFSGSLAVNGANVTLSSATQLVLNSTSSSAIQMNQGSITGVYKLSVNTVDPVYNIGRVNYATYAPDIIGIKTEVFGKAELTAQNPKSQILNSKQAPNTNDQN